MYAYIFYKADNFGSASLFTHILSNIQFLDHQGISLANNWLVCTYHLLLWWLGINWITFSYFHTKWLSSSWKFLLDKLSILLTLYCAVEQGFGSDTYIFNIMVSVLLVSNYHSSHCWPASVAYVLETLK